MTNQVAYSPLIELTASGTDGPAFSMFKRSHDDSGQVRFDDVPPGQYHIRLAQFFGGWAPGRVLRQVEVISGKTQEVTVHVPQERRLPMYSG